MKTCELSGALLDYWVAKAKGFTGPIPRPGHRKAMDWVTPSGCHVWFGAYKPHRNWAQAGPIIESEHIDLLFNVEHYCNADEPWYAQNQDGFFSTGPTPLIAAMRCYVESELGEDVPDAP